MNAYKKRAEETLKKLQTNQTDWTACIIQDFSLQKNPTTGKHNWIPSYLVPNGYIHVETDYPFDEGGHRQCELCSHEILYFYALKHDKNKWYMYTGSTCITHFDIKTFVKQEFTKWKDENMKREWKELFVPYVKKARQIINKYDLYLPVEISMDSEWTKFLNNRNENISRQAKAMEEYGWLIDINDDIDENSSEEEVKDAYKKHAPTSVFKRHVKKQKKEKSKVTFKVKETTTAA